MVEEKNIIEILIEIGVISATDDPINVMLTPRTVLREGNTGHTKDDLESFHNRSAHDPFWATLGHAIQAYARLEQSLCSLFRIVTGMTEEYAGIVFYKITSSNARDDILEKLTKRKYGESYAVFWRSLIKMLSRLSQIRNSAVHWRAGIHPVAKEIRLTLPYLGWLKDIDNNEYLNTAHLTDFAAKCEFIQNRISKFLMLQDEFWTARIKPEILAEWREICQNEVIYPPSIP